MDQNGINPDDLVDRLEEVLEPDASAFDYRGVLYLVPTFQNPSGSVLSEDRAKRIISIARKYKLLVFCDDVYNLLNYHGTYPPARLFSFDKKLVDFSLFWPFVVRTPQYLHQIRSDPDYHGNVVSNGSFSKLLAPGLRLGWMELPQKLRRKYWEQSAILSSGGCLNHYTSGIVSILLENCQLDSLVDELKVEYGRKAEAVYEILSVEMPQGTIVTKPQGGFFIWVTLPPAMDAGDLLDRAEKDLKIHAVHGKWFSPLEDSKRSFRLSISFYNVDVLCDGVKRLASLANKMCSG